MLAAALANASSLLFICHLVVVYFWLSEAVVRSTNATDHQAMLAAHNCAIN